MILQHPITGHETHAEVAEWLPGCAYFRCPRTGLQWLDPMPANVPVFPDFSSYADNLLSVATPDLIKSAMPPNEQAAMEWVNKQLRPRSKIVELFAEVGRFAWLLRSSGYGVCLADPLASHVAVLRKYGFTTVQAANPAELPAEWADADAVVILESIVRLPQPGAFMAELHARFPRAQVFLTAPSFHRPLKIPGVDRRAAYPPDFMTRWTVPALRELLASHGYISEGHMVTPRLLATSRDRRWRGRIYEALMIVPMLVSREYKFSVSASGRPRTASE